MVVAEIINEINSTQPSANYSQNTRATPIQQARPQMPPQQQAQARPQMPPQQQAQARPQMPPQQQAQAQPQRIPQQQAQPQRRATPFRRPTSTQNQSRRMQNPSSKKKSFLQKQKEKMRNKKVRFKEEVEERIIQENESESENESENDSESDSEDTTPIELVLKKEKKEKVKFLKKDDIQKNDLNETKGIYSRVINFFTNDTKEPLLVLALVFAISMPVVNNLMTRFLPFLMKHGEGSMFVVGVKALVVALAFFTVKKLLL